MAALPVTIHWKSWFHNPRSVTLSGIVPMQQTKPTVVSSNSQGKIGLHVPVLWNALNVILSSYIDVNLCLCVGACDFEQDFCSWVATGTGSFGWFRGANQTATANTGPQYDHTIGNAAGKCSSYPGSSADTVHVLNTAMCMKRKYIRHISHLLPNCKEIFG